MRPRLSIVLLAICWLAGSVYPQDPVKPRTDSLGDPLPDGAVARLGTMRFKHDPGSGAVVTTAVFSPDGTKLITLATNGTGAGFHLWDIATGKSLPGPWTVKQVDLNAMIVSRTVISGPTFSPDGTTIAATRLGFGNNGVESGIVLWDVAAGKELRTLTSQGAALPTSSLVFADGGKTLVSASRNGVKWWDVATGKELQSWQPIGELPQAKVVDGKKTKATNLNLVLSPGATHLAIQAVGALESKTVQAASGETLVFDVAKKKVIWRVKGQGGATSMKADFKQKTGITLNRLVFSADGKRVALVTGPTNVELRDVATGKLVATPTLEAKSGAGAIGVLALSSDGSKVAIASQLGPVVLWNPPEPAALRNFAPSSTGEQFYVPRGITFSPDSKHLLVATGGDLRLYEIDTLKAVNAHVGHRGPVNTVGFAPDGQRLVTGSGSEDPFRYNRFGFRMQPPSPMSAESLAWDPASWNPLQASVDQIPNTATPGDYSLDHSMFVSRNAKNPFGVFNAASGKLIGRFTVPKSRDTNMPGFFSPSGKFYLLPSGANGDAVDRLYAVASSKLVSQWPGAASVFNEGPMRRPFSYSADESLIALADSDGFYYVIQTATGKVHKKMGTKLDGDVNEFLIEIPPKVSLSPDGKRLATWNFLSDAIIVWDVPTGKPTMLHTRLAEQFGRGGFFPDDMAVAFAWSPDSRMLAISTMADAGKIQLWEMATRRVRTELVGHQGNVNAVAFSPDGRWLASGSADTTVLVWDVWGTIKRFHTTSY